MKKSSSDLRSQVGQVLICGFDGTELTPELCNRLSVMQPGGIILFKRNLVSSKQTHSLLRECQRAVATPMFLCVDMEGGTVDRLRDVIAPVPPVSAVAATGLKKLYREHGRLLGSEVRALGFNVDFTPVLDLGLPESSKVLMSRTVSASPQDAIAYAKELLQGLKDCDVLGSGKHFPGLGGSNLDSHVNLPTVSRSWKQLWNEDLLPYRKLKALLPFVMVAHCAYPAVTKDNTPASISKKWLTDILRKKIGYRGIILSDDLDMGGVLASASIEDAAIACMRAGADSFLVCQKEESVSRAYEAVLQEAERDRRFRALIETAAKRIVAFKKRSAAMKRKMAPAPDQKTIDRLRQKNWTFTEEVRLAANRRLAM
ncbi:MAG TPA: beta-N-acetylhexosaminidase [Terriglobales bacterium]|nr:beta-N-acetylhexosaminidase [Terriglobales bacterium]